MQDQSDFLLNVHELLEGRGSSRMSSDPRNTGISFQDLFLFANDSTMVELINVAKAQNFDINIRANILNSIAPSSSRGSKQSVQCLRNGERILIMLSWFDVNPFTLVEWYFSSQRR